MVGDRVATDNGMVGERDIDTFKGLVAENAVFHQETIVECIDVVALVVQSDVTIDEVAVHEFVVEVDPFTTGPIHKVFAVVEAGI